MNKKKFTLGIIIVLFFISLITIQYYDYLMDRNVESEYESEGINDLEKTDEVEEATVEEEIPPKIESTIVAVGDIMFHTPQIKGAYNSETGEYDFNFVFEEIAKYIENADLAIGNFETVTAGNAYKYSGFPRFNSPKSTVAALKNAGFDILSTANNHSLDRGKEGIIKTIEAINEQDIKNVGTYKEPTEDILIEDINGIQAAVLSYTYGCNGLEVLLSEEELSYMVNIIDEDKIKNDIEKADESQVDMTIVVMHWGNEYQREPSQYQIDLAYKMIEWGADIILGSHPHVIQKSEIVKHDGEDKFIIYSMGNFISNQRRETLNIRNRQYTEDGVIVKLTLEKDFEIEKTRIKDVEFIPTWVYRYGENGVYKHVILPTIDYLSEENDNINMEVLNRVEESYNNTIDILNWE